MNDDTHLTHGEWFWIFFVVILTGKRLNSAGRHTHTVCV